MNCSDTCLFFDHKSVDKTQFFQERTRVARKQHRCVECARAIATGEKYRVGSGMSDGKFWTRKTCLDCWGIGEALACDGFVFGQLWTAITEDLFPDMLNSGPFDCLAKIPDPHARRAFSKRFEEYRMLQ